MHPPVLIVEDVEEIRLYLQHLMSQLGFTHVDTAKDGRQASELFNSNAYRLVLLDIELPDINGKTLLEQYKLKVPDLSVIICSSHNTVENVKNTWDMGANGFLAKPVDLSKLQNLLIRLGFEL